MFTTRPGRDTMLSLFVLLSFFCHEALGFIHQDRPAFITSCPRERSLQSKPTPPKYAYSGRAEVRMQAFEPWEKDLLRGPHPLSSRAKSKRPPSRPPSGEAAFSRNETSSPGPRAVFNSQLVKAAKNADYQLLLDLIYEELMKNKANGVNLATALIRLSWAGPEHWTDLMLGSRNGRRFDALMKAIRNEVSGLSNNNLVNVLAALGTMVSAYTPQEDLLRNLKQELMERMPDLGGDNLSKVLEALQKLIKEERPRAVFDAEFKQAMFQGMSTQVMEERDGRALCQMIIGPCSFVERGQAGLTSFLDQASEAVIRAAKSLKLIELARVLNGFARYGDICDYQLSAEALDVLSSESMSRLPGFNNSHDASLLFSSMFRCCEHAGIAMPRSLLTTYEKVTYSSLDRFQAQHLSMTINIYARASYTPKTHYLRAVAQAAEERLQQDQFSGQGLANLLNGLVSFFGIQGFQPDISLLDECTRVLSKDKLSKLSPRHLSSIIQALGKSSEFMRWRPSLSWLAAVEQTARRKLPESNSREVAAMLHGLSLFTNGPECKDLLEAVSRQQQLVAECNCADAASILMGLAKFNYRPDETLLRLLAKLTLGNSGASVASSSSSSSSSPGPGGQWTGRLMANTLVACAKLDWMPPSGFWTAVVEWFEKGEEPVGLSHLASSLWSLAVLDAPARMPFLSGLWDALVDQAATALADKEYVSPGDVRQLWQSLSYAERLQPDLSTTAERLRVVLMQYCGASDSTFEEDLEAHSSPLRTSILQKQVKVVLDDMLHAESQAEVAEGYIYTIDMVVHPLPPDSSSISGGASVPLLPVVIEVDGPSHFFSNDLERPNGRTVYKRRLLNADIGRRWSAVVPVSYMEWDQLEGEEERAAFMLERFKTSGVKEIDAYFDLTRKGGRARQGGKHRRRRRVGDEEKEEGEEEKEQPLEVGGETAAFQAGSISDGAGGGDDDVVVSRQGLMVLKVAELKALCRAAGLTVGGTKAELVERLVTVRSPGGRQVGGARVEEAEREADRVTVLHIAEEGGMGAVLPSKAGRKVGPEADDLGNDDEATVVVAAVTPAALASPPPPPLEAREVVDDVMSLMGLKVVDLKGMCRELRVGVSGGKRALIERIVDERVKQRAQQRQ